MAKIGVIGAGSWGTALALLCHKNGHEVTIWSIMKDEVEMLRTKRQHETKTSRCDPSGKYRDHQ